jgi:hypothetical protein
MNTVAVIVLAVVRGDDREGAAGYVTALVSHLAANMRGDRYDIFHHTGKIREDIGVDALEDIASTGFGLYKKRIVDMTVTVRLTADKGPGVRKCAKRLVPFQTGLFS